MAIVVIGGHSRNVGKTSVVAGLIAKLPAYNWTAFKLTQFGHGRCSLNGRPCQCETADHAWAITEEKDTSGKTDSSRFLAGRRETFFLGAHCARQAGKGDAGNPAQIEGVAENAILESNSILKFIQPDIYISVLDPANEDFKSSAQQYLERADAMILHRSGDRKSNWQEISLPDRPVFVIDPPDYVSSEVVEFVDATAQVRAARARTIP